MTITFLPLLNLLDRAPWTEESLCSKSDNPDAWFPVSTVKSHDAAILTCAMCPVIGQCAAEAVASGETWGIRAGIFHDGSSGVDRRHREALTAIAEANGVKVPDPVRTSPIANADKTHCKRGHEFTPENTRTQTNGGRSCRQCYQIGKRARAEQQKAASS
ncbi:WhiB family transcriptional regulator [Rhodococcus erythropolis]|uniref:WhiB family transcriptional regulator n=1 Tax=Rhodococcus erythropolis TaxID=1833 RepID=UPI0024BB885F|nr:WhiB family transcriptional regulator [Rhodococcus erythropolis]MDJ0405849.1 WhiB family transcriptional regulator [Rhodococcus erythropolis]